jgi:hypothetical protein
MHTNSIREAFDALGGIKAVAELVGVKEPAVYMAALRGSIPHRWRLPIFKEAERLKVQIAPELLGLEQQ